MALPSLPVAYSANQLKKMKVGIEEKKQTSVNINATFQCCRELREPKGTQTSTKPDIVITVLKLYHNAYNILTGLGM